VSAVRTEFVNPFVAAALHVFRQELQEEPRRGPLRLEGSRVTPGEVTVIVGVAGDVEGLVLYGMDIATAQRMVGSILGISPLRVHDDLVESGAAEIGNMITGRASMELEKQGYSCEITPPVVLLGRNILISTVAFNRLEIPFDLSTGRVVLHVALRRRQGEGRKELAGGSAGNLLVNLLQWLPQEESQSR